MITCPNCAEPTLEFQDNRPAFGMAAKTVDVWTCTSCGLTEEH